VGTFKKHPECTCQVCSEQIARFFHKELTFYLAGSLRANWWVKWGQIVSELTMNSHRTCRVSDPLPPVATDMREGGQSHRLLTTKAKAVIRSAIDAGLYCERDHRVEPPFMAPSDNPDHYPLVSRTLVKYSSHTLISQKWCTYCNDFGEDLVLCLGCRNAVCLATTDDPTGCLKWNDDVKDNPDFTWECFTCTRGKRAMTVSTASCALPVAH